MISAASMNEFEFRLERNFSVAKVFENVKNGEACAEISYSIAVDPNIFHELQELSLLRCAECSSGYRLRTHFVFSELEAFAKQAPNSKAAGFYNFIESHIPQTPFLQKRHDPGKIYFNWIGNRHS